MQCEARAAATEATAYSCSSRSLSEASRAAANSSSRTSSLLLRIVPARTRLVTKSPSRLINNSGVAPIKPSTAKVQHSGYVLFNSRSNQPMFNGCASLAITSLAKTTLSSSPWLIRRTASSTLFCHSETVLEPSKNCGSRF